MRQKIPSSCAEVCRGHPRLEAHRGDDLTGLLLLITLGAVPLLCEVFRLVKSLPVPVLVFTVSVFTVPMFIVGVLSVASPL